MIPPNSGAEPGRFRRPCSLVADGEGEVREQQARGGGRGLQRWGELEAVAEGPEVGGRGGGLAVATQPPPAAPRGLEI